MTDTSDDVIEEHFKTAIIGAEVEFGLVINQETARQVILELRRRKRGSDCVSRDTRLPHLIVSDILNGLDGYKKDGNKRNDRRSSMHSVVNRYINALAGKKKKVKKKPARPKKIKRGFWDDLLFNPIVDALQVARERNEHIIGPDGEDLGLFYRGPTSPFGRKNWARYQ